MLSEIFNRLESNTYAEEGNVLRDLIDSAALSSADRARISDRAADLVRAIRQTGKPGLMEVFLAEYGLSTNEGIALMCLAEALLRVPDADTIDALIEDKIAPSDWGKHLGHSSSSLVNASTWALMLTGKVLDDSEPGIARHLRGAVKRLGEPVIRNAVARAMREMGRQFVLGETIGSAMKRAQEQEKIGYTYSYDMLGEAARTDDDARKYHLSYSRAISAIAAACNSKDIRENPGISVKLSALHPRYEVSQKNRVMEELVPRVRSLALLAKSAGMGFNIDAEEADRLALSLDVIEAVLSEPALAGWDGFGVVVQAYGPRTGDAIDWLYALASKLDRQIMVRLVKGAYWDTEVKLAQVEGMARFPVFTRKASTDVSYISNASKLLTMTDRIYPQFATHNAHTVAAILDIAKDKRSFEFQRLHGMGERLHDIVMEAEGSRCRIYAPVGEHQDLLAYLVRRLLENGANSSFVNQIVDENVPPEQVAADPFSEVEGYLGTPVNPVLKTGPGLFGTRRNSRGWDLSYLPDIRAIDAAREAFKETQSTCGPLITGDARPAAKLAIINPADPADQVGIVKQSSEKDVEVALSAATPWKAAPSVRADVLRRASDLFEENFGAIFALLSREAGKIQLDCVGELREAVDFLRYYADQAISLDAEPAGLFTCISPWNFPLAIFSGQIGAALAAGNGVLAKPAEQTPLIADLAVSLLHKAGVPRAVLQLLPGDGPTVGAALTSDPRINGVAFTGSTDTAQTIRRTMAENLDPSAPLIAETGGLNAMIVDSTALPEQAVQAIVESAFQSAGQRCSALRCLYVQEDIAENFKSMLFGAMDELDIGQPWKFSVDVGPVIDEQARQAIIDYVNNARSQGRVLKEMAAPGAGLFVGPVAISVNSIADMKREIFGPVLHIATFKSGELDRVVDDINQTGFGLTFGLHTRIDDRVQHVVERVHAGNIYVNRNQIGAIVGSQPFGGEGLSGTGPKAGGPNYLPRFTRNPPPTTGNKPASIAKASEVQNKLNAAKVADATIRRLALPGPTGESNQLGLSSRAPVLCLGPGTDVVAMQASAIRSLGGHAVAADGLPAAALANLSGFSGAMFWGQTKTAREYALVLAQRSGAILPLIAGAPDLGHAMQERHVCVDTTAAGGNAALLAEVGDS